MCDLVDNVESLQKKLKTSHQKSRRLKKKVKTLADVVSELKEKNLINSDCAAILETTFSGVIISRTNVASVGSVFNNTRKVKVLSLPETIQEKIDVSSEGPSSGVSSGGQGKTTRVFIRGNTKTSRDKIIHLIGFYFVT